MLGPVRSLGVLVLGVALVVMVAVALLALHLARGFTRPLIQLTGVAEQISRIDMPQLIEALGRVAAGEEAARFEQSARPLIVRSSDEVGQLGHAFNAMTASLDAAHAYLVQTQAQLRIQKEAAEAANQAKSTFLTNMSHELRTPLNGILGYAQILARTQGLSNLQSTGLAVIHQSGEHLLSLIDDILNLAKIEAGKLELVPGDIHLPNFLQGIAHMCRVRAEQKGLSFLYDAPPDLPLFIRADEKRLRQVLLNIVGNAIKFTHTGSVAFRVNAARSDSGAGCALHYAVTDTGVGISAADLQRIFQPFEQVGPCTPTSRRQRPGAGNQSTAAPAYGQRAPGCQLPQRG